VSQEIGTVIKGGSTVGSVFVDIKEVSTEYTYYELLEDLDIIDATYNDDGNLVTQRYTNDGDTEAPYYRDELSYNDDGDLIEIKHYYNTSDLDTESGKTEIGYTDGKRTNVTYTE
jgi:hypothetical protein